MVPFLLPALVAAVALLYASVGHGGASGYLAVLAVAGLPPAEMASTALVLNLLVAGISWLSFARAGHFRPRLLAPFLLSSLPAAWLGGYLSVSPRGYALLLAFSLTAAAARMALPDRRPGPPAGRPPRLAALGLGAGIGFLSGAVGVGGGIFLSPLLLILRWADPKETAAASAAFIWLNSLAAIVGRAVAGSFGPGATLWLLAAALAGGLAGAHLGARRFAGLTLRRLLAAVLLVAAAKLLLQAV